MIAAWMLYCVVLGTLVAGSAHLAELLVSERGGATRRVWVNAAGAAVVLPILALLLRDDPAALVSLGPDSAPSVSMLLMMESVDFFSTLDGVLLRTWAAASGVLAVLLLSCLAVVAWRRRSWAGEEIDGVPVLVSEDVGPAVVGILRTRIVLPRWACGAEAAERALLLRHEQEHVAAGDPRLILFSALLIVAMPWNPALWYMGRRTRMAVEVDCDRRVVRCPDVDVRRYGRLLLTVGRLRSARAAALVGFSRSRSLLEHRLDRMTLERRLGVWRSVALACGVAGILAAAWMVPQPVRAESFTVTDASCPGADPAHTHGESGVPSSPSPAGGEGMA